MPNLTTLEERIERGEEYLLALERFRDWEWRELREAYLAGRFSVPQAMTLIHPDFYRERERRTHWTIRGPRRFSSNAGQHATCMSGHIWLKRCSLGRPEIMQSDHLFPYSLGGPTIAANQLFLCPVHNRAKASDIHLFPWEEGAPSWLPDQIGKIGDLIL